MPSYILPQNVTFSLQFHPVPTLELFAEKGRCWKCSLLCSLLVNSVCPYRKNPIGSGKMLRK